MNEKDTTTRIPETPHESEATGRMPNTPESAHTPELDCTRADHPRRNIMGLISGNRIALMLTLMIINMTDCNMIKPSERGPELKFTLKDPTLNTALTCLKEYFYDEANDSWFDNKWVEEHCPAELLEELKKDPRWKSTPLKVITEKRDQILHQAGVIREGEKAPVEWLHYPAPKNIPLIETIAPTRSREMEARQSGEPTFTFPGSIYQTFAGKPNPEQ